MQSKSWMIQRHGSPRRSSARGRTIGGTLAALVLMGWCGSALADLEDSRCYKAIQGEIAWNYDGSKRWATRNIDKLCGDARASREPAKCFRQVMHGGVDWGGGTQWQWENAVNLCQGTTAADATVACFRSRVDGAGWSEAISQCRDAGGDCEVQIADKYDRLGGRLGSPEAGVRTNPRETGKRRKYDNGHIYCSASTGAHPIYDGPIWNEWADQKWEQGPLGYPVEDPRTNPDSTGKRQRFEGGFIYWHPDTGAHVIRDGDIWDRWADQKWEQGNLGYPIAERTRTPDGKGWMQFFEGGVIASNARGNVRRFRHCNATAKHNIRQAVLFLELNLDSLKHDFDLADRKLKRKRIRRKMDRKISKLKFNCAERVLCRDDADRIAMKAGLRKIRLCYDKVEPTHDFCRFAGLIGHEFGHLVKIPKKRLGRHYTEGGDRVYMFGDFVETMCEGTDWERDLTPLPP